MYSRSIVIGWWPCNLLLEGKVLAPGGGHGPSHARDHASLQNPAGSDAGLDLRFMEVSFIMRRGGATRAATFHGTAQLHPTCRTSCSPEHFCPMSVRESEGLSEGSCLTQCSNDGCT